jgi:hypothetical protein
MSACLSALRIVPAPFYSGLMAEAVSIAVDDQAQVCASLFSLWILLIHVFVCFFLCSVTRYSDTRPDKRLCMH